MRALIVLLALLASSPPLFAQDDGINPEIANCEEIRDPATLTQVEFCTAHVGCKLVMGIQKACTKVKTFLNKLKNLSFGKNKIDSNDVFEAAAPSAEGDVGFNNISQSIKSSYEKQPKREIVSGKFESGVIWVYEGALAKGQRNGTGVLITDSGTIFRGDFVEGRQAGLGEMVSDKSRKAGVMAGAKMDGFGVERFADGVRYEGEYKADKYDGKGVLTQANGSRLEASFKDGAANGKGVYAYANGSRYEGDFVNGQFSGQGIHRWADGSEYIGSFVKNKRNGQGTYRWANGNQYSGNYVDEIRHGRGTFVWASGARFEGEYRDGIAYNGTKINADGTRIKYANGAAIEATPPPAQAKTQAVPEADSGVNWGDVIRGVADVIKARADSKARASSGGSDGDSPCGGIVCK